MKLSQFIFKLPKDQIAEVPCEHRDESRLLVLHKESGDIEHKQFKDLIEYFSKDDVIVYNNTKVFPARLFGEKEKKDGKIEVFLLRELKSDILLWDVLVDPARKIRIGNKIYFGDDDLLVAEVIDNTTSRGRALRFIYEGDHDSFKKLLFSYGQTPIPEYIKRLVEPEDEERYQTIYASEEGAVVAPSAGLHFSRELLKRLELQDVRSAYLTLHCSPVMNAEIDVDDLNKYKMGSERMLVNEECCGVVNNAKREGKQICLVGTSTLKAVETCLSTDGFIKPYDGWTGKFIFPEYHFTLPTSLISGFHMPYSSLLMSVASFGGYKHVMNAYNVAVKEGYRFGAYGDAMLII